MALSGNFNTNKYSTSSSGSIGLNLSWTATQDIATNSTTIDWVLKSNGTMSTGYSVWGGPITVTINGTNVYYQSGRVRIYGGGSFRKTGSIVVNHDSDGTKTVSMSVRAALYTAEVNCTGSASYTLDPIQRYAYIVDAENFTDEGNPTVHYANPLGNVLTSTQICISLDGTTETISYRDIDKNGSSYKFNLTSSERNTLLSNTPNSNSRLVYFIIKSVLYGVTYYSVMQKTMTVVNANPTITGAEYYDTNQDTIAITGDSTKIVQSVSTVEFKFASLSAQKYATLSYISIEINGTTQTVSLSGSSQSNITKLFGTLNLSNNIAANVELIDSRGNKTRLSLTVSVLQWSLPSAVITAARINNFYTETNFRVLASYSSINGNNNVIIKYQTKKATESSYGSLVIIQNDTPYIINLDNTYEWNIRIIIQDSIGGTVTYYVTIGKGIPLLFFDTLRNSIGVNRLPIGNNSLETDGWIAIGGLWQNSFRTYGGANNNGVSGYVRAARIEILDVYANVAIEIKLYRRSDIRPVVLYLRFANENSIDPDVSMLGIENVPGVSAQFKAFAYKRGTSKWDIYAIKSEAWDDISIVTSIPEYMKSKIDVTYEDDLIVSVPSGAVEAVIIT